jgi:hypothetical protein
MDRGVTPAQLRALHAGFYRAGYTRRADRLARLAAAGQVLGLDGPVGSFTELRFGQAGYLLGWLRRLEASGPEPVPEADRVPAAPPSGKAAREHPGPAAPAAAAATAPPPAILGCLVLLALLIGDPPAAALAGDTASSSARRTAGEPEIRVPEGLQLRS